MATTPAALPGVFESWIVQPGIGGLDAHTQIDLLDRTQLRRCVNLWRVGAGPLEVRPGSTNLKTGLQTPVHTIQEQEFPTATPSLVRLIGNGARLSQGQAGNIADIDAGYSGDPLTILTGRPQTFGDEWTVVADRLKMRLVSPGGTVVSLGQPAPAAAISAVVSDILTTDICDFEAGDTGGASAATNWTLTAGVDRSETPVASAAPTAADITGLSGNAVEFTLVPGSVAKGFNSRFGIARAINLTTLQGGAHASDLDDFIHLWLRVSDPQVVEEVRVYFVCSAAFDASVIPGTSLTNNTDAYVKAFRPHDFTGFVEGAEGALTAGQRARTNTGIDRYEQDENYLDPVDPYNPRQPARRRRRSGPSTDRIQQENPGGQSADQLAPGRGQWTEYGAIGRPLRKRDFIRIGTATDRGWGTITGIVIVVQTSSVSSVKLACDDWFLTGGYGLDSSEPDAMPYDWRATNYHLDTGDEGNPSPIMEESAWLDCLRRRATVTPAPSGDPRVRQRFYRRGGSLPDDWYYVGQNSSDGGQFVDTVSDEEASSAGTLELDNDQPITTTDSSGGTVRANPLPVIWGPVEGLIFGCGDSYRPGYLYWSKPSRAGSWPPTNALEVCSAEEKLQAGLMYGGLSFLFSRDRLYAITVNLSTGNPVVTTTECTEGLAARWAWAVGEGAIWFVSKDGIRKTQGGRSELISLPIWEIFHGASVEQLPAIDWEQETAVRLTVHDGDLWFLYRGLDGTRRCLVYDIHRQLWHGELSFAVPPAVVYSEPAKPPSLLLGGAASGVLQILSGYADQDGASVTQAISCQLRTGFWDLGVARAQKQGGDCYVDLALAGQAELTLYLNEDVSGGFNRTITATATRAQYLEDNVGNAADLPRRFRTAALDLTFTSPLVSRPQIYALGLSALLEPELEQVRPTDWERLSQDSAYLMGMRVDCLVPSAAIKRVFVDWTDSSDTVHTLGAYEFGTTGTRQRVNFTWPAVRATMVRLRPDTEVPWLLYGVTWIGSPEPPALLRWEVQAIDHGRPDWKIFHRMFLTLLSSASVTLTITVYDDSTTTLRTFTYQIPSTGGVKHARYIPFDGIKGVLLQYVLTSSDLFRLYPEGCWVEYTVWGAAELSRSRPFGTQDLDGGRPQGLATPSVGEGA